MRRPSIKNLFIIKTGESETFVDDTSSEVSLGDVFRTRKILNLKRNYNTIYWITSNAGLSLLKYDKELTIDSIDELEKYSNIMKSEDTVVLNLEKSLNIIQHLDFLKIDYFGWSIDKSEYLFKSEDNIKRNLSELFTSFGPSWGKRLIRSLSNDSMDFCIPNLPIDSSSKYQIGFNWKVGNKWTNKSLPEKFWKELEGKLIDKYSISWQQGEKNVDDYIKWISSCALIITHDSLGVHLALGLNKKIIGLFGITNPLEIDWSKSSSYLQFDPAKEYDENNVLIEQIINEINKWIIK